MGMRAEDEEVERGGAGGGLSWVSSDGGAVGALLLY